MMLNNKGFAVSTILYALLITFLLFLLVTLKQISSSTNLMNSANDDIVNGTNLFARQVINGTGCRDWFEQKNDDAEIINTIVKIYSRYGVKYWPRDFNSGSSDKIQVWYSDDLMEVDKQVVDSTTIDNLISANDISWTLWTGSNVSSLAQTDAGIHWLKITDTLNEGQNYYLPLFNICG